METDSVSEDDVRDLLGRKVRKHFEGHGVFVGEVVSYNHKRKFFRVNYEDGDKEEVDLSELLEILWDTSDGTNGAQERKRRKKRKAGSKIAVENVTRHIGSMSLENVGGQVEQAVLTETLETSNLRRVEEQPYEPPLLPVEASLHGSELEAMEDHLIVGRAIRRYSKRLVGSTVEKFFPGHGLFLGTVVAYHTRHQFFTVEYIDGDAEELDWSELKEILVNVPECNLSRKMRLMGYQAARKKDVATTTNPREVRPDEVGAALERGFGRKGEDEEGPCETSQSLAKTDTNSYEGDEAKSGPVASHETVYAVIRDRTQMEAKTGHRSHTKKFQGQTEDMEFARVQKYKKEVVDNLDVVPELGSHLLRTKFSSMEDVGDNDSGGDEWEVSFGGEEKAGGSNHSYRKQSAPDSFGGTRRFRRAECQETEIPEPYESPVQSVCDVAVLKPQKVKPVRPSTSSEQASSSKPRSHHRRKFVGRTVRKHFEGFGDFTGEVISYHAYSGYFKVEYTDGDMEEVDLTELSEIIVAEQFLGRAVRKHFEGFGDYEGQVLRYDERTNYFKVEYTDGDREELDLAELGEILVAEEAVEVALESKGQAGRKKKQT